MTKSAYLKALAKLNLTPASRATAAALGLSLPSIQRIAAGRQAVPPTVALLLAMYVTHGLPDDH